MISVSKELRHYCSEPIENIENYDKAIADDKNMWECHHRLEIQGQFRNSKALLIKCGMYWNVPAWQLIFLRRDEHTKLHHQGDVGYWLGKHHSDETRKKMSASRKGSNNHNFGKHLSDETRRKISETKRKKKCQSF